MLLKWLAPLWIVEVILRAWARGLPNGGFVDIDASPLLATALPISSFVAFCLLPLVAGYRVSSRGGSHLATLVAGASITGADHFAFAIGAGYDEYQYLFYILLAPVLLQAPLGWIGGWVARRMAQRRSPDAVPVVGIDRMDALGTALLYFGIWAGFVALKFLYGGQFLVALVAFASGILLIYNAARIRRHWEISPELEPPRLRKRVIAVAMTTLIVVPVGMLMLLTHMLNTRATSALAQLCESVTPLTASVAIDPKEDLHGSLIVKVRANQDVAVSLENVQEFNGSDQRSSSWIFGGDEVHAVKMKAGEERELTRGFTNTDKFAIVGFAICPPDETDVRCVWWGANHNADLHPDGRTICGAMPPSAP